jgi:hypothetical protein
VDDSAQRVLLIGAFVNYALQQQHLFVVRVCRAQSVPREHQLALAEDTQFHQRHQVFDLASGSARVRDEQLLDQAIAYRRFCLFEPETIGVASGLGIVVEDELGWYDDASIGIEVPEHLAAL